MVKSKSKSKRVKTRSSRVKTRSSRVKTRNSRVKTRSSRVRNRITKKKILRGGNYETDITTRTVDGVATKPLNKIVVTVPGYGTMSGTAYKSLMEEIDRDGPDAFLK